MMLNLVLLTVLVSVVSAQYFPFPPPGRPEDTRQNTGPFRPVDPDTRRQPAPPPENVDLVIVGVTTGNRNPDVFLRDDPNRGRWGEEGPGMLNTVGKREALGLGRALRRRYGRILSEQFYPTNYVSYSSTGGSECMTAQTVNTGLFPPVGRGIFDPSIQWQPVPVTTDDHLLGMTRVDRCPTVREALRPIFNGDTPEVREVLRRERTVVDYVVRSTGVRRNIEDISEVAENLRQLRRQKMRFPGWAENPSLPGYDRERLYRTIQVFRNALEVACSVNTPCRKIVSGVLLNNIARTIRNNVEEVRRTNVPRTTTRTRTDTTTTDLGMVVYTGDVEVILSVMRVLNMGTYNVPTTGGFLLEVRNIDTNPTVRVLYHQPDTTDPTTTRFYVPTRTPTPTTPTTDTTRGDCTTRPCNVREFLRRVEREAITDYRVACNERECTVVEPTYHTFDTEDNEDLFSNPKTMTKGVDCTRVRDKFPVGACVELARENYCTRNNFVRNVVCLRTCHCTRFETTHTTVN